MASKNSSKDEFETLHGPLRLYLFEPTAKPGAEWIKLLTDRQIQLKLWATLLRGWSKRNEMLLHAACSYVAYSSITCSAYFSICHSQHTCLQHVSIYEIHRQSV